jgi:capsular polysaccharide biosynthesis protein
MTAGDVYRALWRHKLFILLLTAACVAGAWYATSRQERVYEASTLVRIQQRAVNPGDAFVSLEASERLSQTYVEILDSGALTDQIAARAAKKKNKKAPVANAADVSISATPVAGVALLWIAARSANPAAAAAAANAASTVLRDFAQGSSAFEQIVTVKPASKPRTPVEPNTKLNLALALLLALVFNSALVLSFEVLRDRLPASDELGAELGYPVLATIPTLRLRRVKDLSGPEDLGGTAAEDVLTTGASTRPSRRAFPG